MKEGIHPEYKSSKVLCACGAVIETRSTRGDFHIEICSSCHPFFTGKQKILDTAGRIERFKNRYAATTAAAADSKKVAPPPPPRTGQGRRQGREPRRQARQGQRRQAEARAEAGGRGRPEDGDARGVGRLPGRPVRRRRAPRGSPSSFPGRGRLLLLGLRLRLRLGGRVGDRDLDRGALAGGGRRDLGAALLHGVDHAVRGDGGDARRRTTSRPPGRRRPSDPSCRAPRP